MIRHFSLSVAIQNSPLPTRLFCFLFTLVLLAGRAVTDGEPDSQTPPEPTPIVANGIIDEPNGAPPGIEDRQLVLWLPDFFDPGEDSAAGSILETTFFQFEQSHPGLSIDVQIKAEFGQTGLPNYLRAAQRVAPSIIPDIVLIHSSQLWQIADLGIVPPLESHELPAVDDFFPFSRDSILYRGQQYGIPYIANMVHAVGIPAEDSPIPATWAALLESEGRYLFPAGGVENFRLASAVFHYRAAGGLLTEDGAPGADPVALEAFFNFIAAAHSNGQIPDRVLDYAIYESLWNAYSLEEGDIMLITAQDMLREPATGVSYLSAPTATGSPQTIGNAWAFAVLTRDENYRELALELLDVLLEPEIHSMWTQAANRLPTRAEALSGWSGGQSDYVTFIESQIENVDAFPTGRPFADFARRLHNAQAGLLRGELSIEEAIVEARTPE